MFTIKTKKKYYECLGCSKEAIFAIIGPLGNYQNFCKKCFYALNRIIDIDDTANKDS